MNKQITSLIKETKLLNLLICCNLFITNNNGLISIPFRLTPLFASFFGKKMVKRDEEILLRVE